MVAMLLFHFKPCIRIFLTAMGLALISGGSGYSSSQEAETTEAGDYHIRRIVEDGSWNYRGRPVVAIAGGKLFVSYVTSNGEARIRSVHLKSGEVKTAELSTPGIDMHNNPSFTFDSQGRVVVFYSIVGGYNNRKHIARGIRPHDISEFEILHDTLASKLTGNVGSQSAMWSDGEGKLFLQNYTVYRGARRELLFISEDDGETFNEHNLWSFALGREHNDRSYTLSFFDPVRGRLHFMALDKNMEVPKSHGLYYVYYDAGEDRFFRADGSPAFDWADTPVTDGHAMLDVIADPSSGHARPFWSSINVDQEGNAYLTWGSRQGARGSGMVTGGVTEYWSRFEDGKWRHYPVGSRTGWRTGSHINPRDPWEVYLPVTVDDFTTQIQKRRFCEASGSFDRAVSVSDLLRIDLQDRGSAGVWAPSGPPHLSEGVPEMVVWNYGRFSSQYQRGGGYLGSIMLGIRSCAERP